MAYQINKTDGSIVATVADGQVDTLSTNLTLIGKNYSGFGEALNENFIKLLENFASTTTPTRPIKGQVWFDSSENKLKVYNGTSFIPVSSATISNNQPDSLTIGDLWFDNIGSQLYFYDGTNPILLGPSYSSAQRISGLKVDSILDTLNQTRVVTYLYNNGILLGIFANDSFVPKIEIVGYSGSIGPGFNAGTLDGMKFDVTCTNAEQLGGLAAALYVRQDSSSAISGQFRIVSDSATGGLVVGSDNQARLFVENSNVLLSNNSPGRNLVLQVNKDGTSENAIAIDAINRSVNIYEGQIASETNIGGNLVVAGNLTVEGSTTTLNTTDLVVEDKNIVIANVDSPTNTTADGAGITIKGETDKTILYSNADNWLDVSEAVRLATGKALYIGNSLVIDGNSLGSSITSIPGVTSFGTQNILNVGPGIPPVAQLRIETNTGSGKPRISTVSSNLDIEIAPDGTGNVALIGSPKITGMADPTSSQDAATKAYVDSTIESRPVIFSMDLTDNKPNTYIITNILNNLAPVSAYRPGTIARILCTVLTNSTTSLNINSLPPTLTSSSFVIDNTFNTANAITNISFPPATISAPSISTSRIIKQFQIFGGVWTWQSDTVLPV